MRISEQLFPRPVVLITTVDKDGKSNVMTASFVMPVSFSPKYVAVAIAPSRYTFKNISEVKEFGVNVCSEEMLEMAKLCGSYSGREVDKFELANLEKESSVKIRAPLIKNSPISFECVVEEMKEFGDHWLVVGRVVREVVRKERFKPLLHKSGGTFPKLKID